VLLALRKRFNHFRTDGGYLSALIDRPQQTVHISDKSKPVMMLLTIDESFNGDIGFHWCFRFPVTLKDDAGG